MNYFNPGGINRKSPFAMMAVATVLMFALPSCSQKGNPDLYGKWQETGSTWYTADKGTANPVNNPADGKVMEFHNDGTYLDGSRPGKFQFVDTNHVNMEIDGLMGEAKITVQGDTLDIWNPDGSTVEHYKRIQ